MQLQNYVSIFINSFDSKLVMKYVGVTSCVNRQMVIIFCQNGGSHYNLNSRTTEFLFWIKMCQLIK